LMTIAPTWLDWRAFLRAAALAALSTGCSKISGEGSTAVSPRGGAPVPRDLVLERALPIDVDEDFEPSGLLLLDGRLLTVSDKNDDTVFELVLGDDVAEARPFIHFEPPPGEPQPFDFEGLSLDHDGSLLLVSEARYRVLSLTRAGKAAWLTPSLLPIGAKAGLFQERNAALEGIARLGDGRLLLAAEREPRGLIELGAQRPTSEARAWAMPDSLYPPPAGRNPDFADLATSGSAVYALERNAHLIVRIERGERAWLEREAWSFGRVENDPRFVCADTSFGLAEGLAMDDQHVYVVLDNNRDARAADTTDHRSLLFIFARPP
jgi:hypothetical protein